MQKNEKNFVRALVESSILLAIGVVLSLLKLLDLPYGGSVTLASMLPIILISYRHGLGFGMMGGVAFGIIQQLLGLKTLGYVTGWQSVVAVILLDYIVAFAVTGLGGIFRKTVKHQAGSLILGSILVSLIRYACHVVSGATVWAGLSIPTEAALLYSFGYNATYMIPETIILILVAYYIASVLDFRNAELHVMKQERVAANRIFSWVGGGLVLAGLVFAVVMVFGKLQDPETGDFLITGLKDVDWLLTGLVSGFLTVLGVGSVLFGLFGLSKKERAVQ